MPQCPNAPSPQCPNATMPQCPNATKPQCPNAPRREAGKFPELPDEEEGGSAGVAGLLDPLRAARGREEPGVAEVRGKLWSEATQLKLRQCIGRATMVLG